MLRIAEKKRDQRRTPTASAPLTFIEADTQVLPLEEKPLSNRIGRVRLAERL